MIKIWRASRNIEDHLFCFWFVKNLGRQLSPHPLSVGPEIYMHHEPWWAPKRNRAHFLSNHILADKAEHKQTVHTVSFDWFLSGLEWILNMNFCLLKLLIFYQKLLWNIRSRLNSSTFWIFRPVFRYVWSKLKLFAQKMKILIKHI